jgi:hypothetical protein
MGSRRCNRHRCCRLCSQPCCHYGPNIPAGVTTIDADAGASDAVADHVACIRAAAACIVGDPVAATVLNIVADPIVPADADAAAYHHVAHISAAGACIVVDTVAGTVHHIAAEFALWSTLSPLLCTTSPPLLAPLMPMLPAQIMPPITSPVSVPLLPDLSSTPSRLLSPQLAPMSLISFAAVAGSDDVVVGCASGSYRRTILAV